MGQQEEGRSVKDGRWDTENRTSGKREREFKRRPKTGKKSQDEGEGEGVQRERRWRR